MGQGTWSTGASFIAVADRLELNPILHYRNAAMRSLAYGFTWWKVILGVILVWINGKQFFFPGSRPLQPLSSAEAAGMFASQCVFMFIGLWLLYSGIMTGFRKGPPPA